MTDTIFEDGPEDVGYGRVVHTVALTGADGEDSDGRPDWKRPTSLSVTFTPIQVAVHTNTPMVTFLPQIVDATYVNGVLVGPDGKEGVVLVDQSDPDIQPNGWTYLATWSGDGEVIPPTAFQVHAGKVVDLSTFILGGMVDGDGDYTLPDVGPLLEAVEDAQVLFEMARAAQTPALSVTATTVDPGQEASVVADGEYPDLHFLLRIPRGQKGDKGDKPAVTWDGTKMVVEGVTGPDLKGVQGDTGDPGHSPSLTWDGDRIAIDGAVTGPHLKGLKGDRGADGTGIEISGSVATYANLPTGLGSGDVGKSYLVSADGLLYIWDGTAFPAQGSGVAFKGDKGDPGDDGADGHSPVLTWSGTKIAIDGVASGPDLKGVPGDPGEDGADGHSPVLTWVGNKIAIDGTAGPDLKGPAGEPGPAPITAWDGTKLVVNGVVGPDLKGPKGDSGGNVPLTTEAQVRDALLAGGEFWVSSTSPIALSTPLVVNRGNTVMHGGWFTVASGVGIKITTNDVTLDSVRVDGGRTDASVRVSTQHLIEAIGTSASSIRRTTIQNCILNDSLSDGIYLEYATDAFVSGCQIQRLLYAGVMVISGLRVHVERCRISDVKLTSGTVDGYGIAFTDTANTVDARSRDCRATNNFISYVDREGIDTHGGIGIIVEGNTVTQCARGVAIVSGNSTRVVAPEECVVTGNRIVGTGARTTLMEAVALIGVSDTVNANGAVTGNVALGYTSNYNIKFVDATKSFLGGNSSPIVPWTDVAMTSSGVSHVDYPCQWMMDNNTVFLRGRFHYPATFIDDRVANITNKIGYPQKTLPVASAKAMNATGGTGTVMVDNNGSVMFNYHNGSTNPDIYWPLQGSYRID